MTVDLATLGLRVDSAQARRAANDLDSLTAAGGRAERGVGGIEAAMARMSRQMGQVLGPLRAVQSLLGVAFAGAIVQQVIALADSYHVLEGRLRLVTRSEAEMAAAHQRLFALSQQTRTAHEATVDLYSRMARASKELGLDQNALIAITKATNQALAISGATAQSAAAAVFQFAQALASGELRGDEFRSMMESAPRLMQAVADGMGAPVGKLRELAETGRLTAEVVTQALLKQAGQIDAEFSNLPVTVGQAWTNVGNAILKTIGEVDTAVGGTSAIASVLMALADNFDKVAGAAAMAGATIAASFVAHGLATMVAAVAAAVAALRAWVVGLWSAAVASGLLAGAFAPRLSSWLQGGSREAARTDISPVARTS
ncbi:MAG: tape measure protein [Alphaproteobacteria bacterium]|nr:tape measure protein [Alphaproteobacteria bacterium]